MTGNDTEATLDIDGESVSILGYGKHERGSCFAYSEKECFYYPDHEDLFRQGYRLAAVSTGNGNTDSKSTKPAVHGRISSVEEPTLAREFTDSDGWHFSRRDLYPEDLLFVRSGEALPPEEAIKKSKSKILSRTGKSDSFQIDPEQIVDLLELSIGRWIDEERDGLSAELRQNGTLGYVMGETTALIDLEQDDFEKVFDQSLLPLRFAYSEYMVPTHNIVFTDSECTDNLSFKGRIRFMTTPDILRNVCEGYIIHRQILRTSDAGDDAEISKDIDYLVNYHLFILACKEVLRIESPKNKKELIHQAWKKQKKVLDNTNAIFDKCENLEEYKGVQDSKIPNLTFPDDKTAYRYLTTATESGLIDF